MLQYYSVLKENTLFKDIEEKDFNQVLSCLNAYIKTYSKNDIVRKSDTPVTEIGIVIKGFVYISKIDYSGNRQILSEITLGKSFGETLAFLNAKNSPITVTAATSTSILFIPVKNILLNQPQSCPHKEQIMQNAILLLAEHSFLLQMKNDILSQKTIRKKLLLYFEYESKVAKSNVFKIHFSREELADFLALNTSALSRELGKMRDEGILTFNKNKFALKALSKVK